MPDVTAPAPLKSNPIAQLRHAPHGFDLFQAISLLERSEPARAPVGTALGVDEAVRLASQADFAFPGSDVAAVRDSARVGPALTLRTAALTLAGGHGPVATPFSELLLEARRQRDYAGLDFLDIFNQRLLGFWYRSRCKRHLALRPHLLASGPLVRAVDALSGLDRVDATGAAPEQLDWLRHAALQGAAPRSITTLLVLLRERIGIPFTARQMTGLWQPLASGDCARLGRQTLGMGTCLGTRVWDQAGGIALRTPPLSLAQFAALLPCGGQYALLERLVARHLQQDFEVTLAPVLAVQPATRLGAIQELAPRLGRSAWLCSGALSTTTYQQPCLRLSGAAIKSAST